MVFPARLEKGLDPANSARMKMVCVHNMQQQVKLQHTLSLAWTALTKAGIRPVLMKGAGLAALYPDPSYRTWGDIDLFVGIDQYHPACAVMRDTFPNALKFDEELDHYKHYNLIADGISIEIHRVSIGFQHPIDACRYAKMEAFGMGHAIPVTGNPSPVTYTLISVMSDLWHTEQDFADHCAIEDDILRPALSQEHAHAHRRHLLPLTEELSDREKDVLIQVVRGLSNKEIADVLFISTHTVISHRKNIARKLNIHSTAGLTIYAIVNKLVDINTLE